ncbi:MAG: MOSC domain-containing protein [Rubricella sp.]
MTATVSALWRHPIKGVGAEPLDSVTLTAGARMPGDRIWAVVQDGARMERAADGWTHCRSFLRGAKSAELMAVTAASDGETITLTHPRRDPITLDLRREDDRAALMDWVRPIYPENRPGPASVIEATQGMSDSPKPYLSILSTTSLRVLSEKAGLPLDQRRFRGNIWLRGLGPWEEFDLVGRTIRVGDVTLAVEDRIDRCAAPSGNPETGRRDTDILRILEESWGHVDFGVFARVIEGGPVARGDAVSW